MSSPNPNPQNLQVQAPSAPPAQAPAPAPQQAPSPAPGPAPQQAPPRVPIEDRQLTPEETEELLRGVVPTDEPAAIDNGDDAEQARMAQDFFKNLPGPTPAQQPAPPPVVPAQVQQQAAQDTLQQQQAQPTQPVQVPIQINPEVEALRVQNQLLQGQLVAIQQQMTQYAQQQQVPAPRAPTPTPTPQQDFQFNVPDNYMAALGHEDVNVRRSALNGLLNGVAQTLAQQMRQEIEQRFSTVPTVVQERLQSYNQAQEVNRDMFGTYPELAPFRQYVQAAAMQIAGNVGLDAWNSDVRDAIAERVAPMVPGLGQKVQQVRAQRIAQMAGQWQQPGQLPVPLPPSVPQAPGQGFTPPPQFPPGIAQPVGGVHGGPVYARDAAGNLVPYQPQQQFVANQQNRPGGQAVDPRLADIWSTLGF